MDLHVDTKAFYNGCMELNQAEITKNKNKQKL